MIRTRRRWASVALVAALAVGTAGCGGDDEGSEADPSGSPTEDVSSTPAESPGESPGESPSKSPTGSSVAAATGIELAEATSALNAPAGWTPADGIVDYASAARGPGRRDSLLLSDNRSLASPDATLDDLVKSWHRVAPEGTQAERLPDVDLDGTPAYCIYYTVKGDPSLNYDISTIRNGQSINITFVLDDKTLEADPQLVESVLASFRWVA